jgi:hypothetical protein
MQVTGRALTEHGKPAGGVALQLVHVGFGGRTTTLAELETGPDGSYTARFTVRVRPVNLQVTTPSPVARSGLPLTSVIHDAPDQLELNLVVPGAAPTGEYARLTGEVGRFLGDLPLHQAREDAQVRDLTLLHRSSRWDARLLATAARAGGLAETTGLPAEAVYALLRAGLPGQPLQLARVSPAAVERALTAADTAGIVQLTGEQRTAARDAFVEFAARTRRRLVGPAGGSSYGDLLAAAGLTREQQDAFDRILAGHAGDVEELWAEAGRAGLPAPQVRTAARLGYLTLNNAALIGDLLATVGERGELGPALVGAGLYQPARWTERITALAGGGDDALARLVPAAFNGRTTASRLDAYAADLARKVRISYPTQVISHMVRTGALRLGAGGGTLAADVATVLDRASSPQLGFRLGGTPLNRFLAEHGDVLFAGLSPERAGQAAAQVKTLQRLYQITPSDEALTVLLDRGVRTAQDVTAMPHRKFVQRYGEALGGPLVADQVYRKAQQTTTVIYTFLGAAKQVASAPAVPMVSPPVPVVEAAKQKLVKQYPTLEHLFGSLDFCECEHCRSVLSPAAYLVDILKFLDPSPAAWADDLADWKAAHGGATYPFPDLASWTAAGSPLPRTPYEELRRRRPDLPRIPLTCENTHTAMPYLDIVNEILECYVAQQSLDAMPVYDTGGATTPDLLAEPANLMPAAYDALKAATYPLTLPFDLWWETVRAFCDHFDTPLWQVLDILRPTDELYPQSGEAYGRAAVFVERLGVPPAEQRLLSAADPLAAWRELYGYHPAAVTEAEALAALRQARPLARRLRVSYRELVALVRTGFVNPKLSTLATLRRLGVSTEDALRYHGVTGHAPFTSQEKAAFEAALGPEGAAWLQGVDPADFGDILVLADPSAACGFETTTLQYADGTPADPMVFVLLNYLVRLWRRLGWPIQELDSAVCAFLPSTPDPRTGAALGPAMASALLGLSHFHALAGLLKVRTRERRRLLALWSDLDDRDYAALFLGGRASTADPAFDHPLGHYLSDPSVPLRDHLAPIQAALRLTAGDIAEILVDARLPGPATEPHTVDTAPLTYEVVSVVHRYAMLARLLRLPVADLVALKGMSGLDPFAPPPDAPVTLLEHDHAYTQSVRFAETATAVKDAGLAVAELEYLFRHRFDPVGRHRAAADPPLSLARTLAAEIARIRAEHAAPADPLALTDELIRQKLALGLPAEVAETFLQMWADTAEYRAVLPVPPGDRLDPQHFAAVAEVQVSYDQVGQEQHLVHRGVLLDGERTALLAALTEPQPGYLAQLLDDVQQQPHDFFDRHLLRTVVPGVGEVGFLDLTDFATLFLPADHTQPADRARRERLAATYLPYLVDRLIRQLVVATAALDTGADPALTGAMLTEPALLDDPDQAGVALLPAYVAVGDGGLTLTATGPDSWRRSGYVEAPGSGGYRFFVACPAPGVTVELRLDHLTDPLLQATSAPGDLEPSAHTQLRAGVPYGLTLEVTGPGGGEVQLLVQGETLAKGPLDRLVTYPRAAVDRLHRAHLLLAKTVALASELALAEVELRHLLTHPGDFADLDLGELPTRVGDDTDARARALFAQFLRLAGYTALRRALGSQPADLVGLLAAARRTWPATTAPADAQEQTLAGACERLARIARRDPATVRAAADLLGFAGQAQPGPDPYPAAVPDLAGEIGIGRLWQVLALAGRLGVEPGRFEPGTLGAWATPEPDAAAAQALRDTVRARYEPEAWRRVVQPIADGLRRRRRDALVAHLVHTLDLDRMEQLYEYFLIDPGTEPVVQTSRVRLAISSVQLFIQRCLLNLEEQVSPAALDSAHWQWMRRYRVWEANRKIFLWPENWLPPEFRDDKTHLFTALEGALLEGDLSNESAEAALFDYLRGLEELARLDIRAVHVQERPDLADNVVHVVGRTFHTSPKYFYRRYADRMWTPWVPVAAEIEGDHVVIGVWRDRVHLFWATFLEESAKPEPASPEGSVAGMSVGQMVSLEPTIFVKAKLQWVEYFQGEWGEPGSTGFLRPKLPGEDLPEGWTAMIKVQSGSVDPAEVFVHATTEPDGSVWVHLTGAYEMAFRLVSRNAAATVEYPRPPLAPPYPTVASGGRGRYAGEGKLSVRYVEKITTKDGTTTESCPKTRSILADGSEYALVTHASELAGLPADVGKLVLPFFYADERHTFFVEPELTETTIEEGDGFILAAPLQEATFDDPRFWEQIELTRHVPIGPPPVERLSPEAVYAFSTPQDQTTRPGAFLQFGDELIGPAGGLTQRGMQ